MTQAEIRQAVRDLVDQQSTDAGTLLPSDNAILDRFIDWAVENVTLDLIDWMPEKQDFITYEDITLVANQANYDLTAEWLQIWCMQRNITDKAPTTIKYIDIDQRPLVANIGQTQEHPAGFYLEGTTIQFVPTPSTAAADYARCWIVAPEVATMVSTGPAKIPRIAHKLIPLDAAILIGTMGEYDIKNFLGLYRLMLDRVTNVLGYRIQQQPKMLKEAFGDKSWNSTLDPAFHDLASDYIFG